MYLCFMGALTKAAQAFVLVVFSDFQVGPQSEHNGVCRWYQV